MYELELTQNELEDIRLAGNYAWSSSLSKCTPGVNFFDESEALQFRWAVYREASGGHRLFPMLDYRTKLAEKLFFFLDSIL